MGAAGARRSAITVFGAINTVIAGLLTFLKNSGLPNRYEYYEIEWRRIREFIEQRERDFSCPGCKLSLSRTIHEIEEMYKEVQDNVEATLPDRFTPVNPKTAAADAKKKAADAKKAAEAKEAEAKEEAGDVSGVDPQDGAQQDGPQVEPTAPSSPSPQTGGLSDHLQEMESYLASKVQHLFSEIGHRTSLAAKTSERDLEAQEATVTQDGMSEIHEYAKRAMDLVQNFAHRVETAQKAAVGLQAHRESV